MRNINLALAATLAAIMATSAHAEEADAPSDVTISGGATVITDYRFRGISQSNVRPAIQGTVTISHKSGFYGSVWGSSIDDYIADNSTELDLIAGYKRNIGQSTIDVGVTYYYYPNSTFQFSDFYEVYGSLSHTLGPVTGKVGVIYAPKQQALSLDGINKEDSLYVSADLSTGIPQTPISVNAHVGHSFERSYLTFGQKYTDWSVGATYTWRNLSLGVSYVDTDKDILVGPRNISKAGVVGSLAVSF